MRTGLITLFLLYSFKSIAQSPVEVFTRLTDSLPSDNIYIHTDKRSYLAGDTMWFKGYIYSQFNLTDQSHNFFVTLSDSRSKILSSKVLPVLDGTVHGDFVIDLNLPEDVYILYAYTPAMLNRQQVYTRVIPVYNPNKPFVQKQPVDPGKTIFGSDNGRQNELADKTIMDIHLFDSLGNKRFVISAKDDNYQDKELLLLGIMEDNIVFKEKLRLKEGLIKGMIPVKGLPPGSLRVFLFDKNILLAEDAATITNDDWTVHVDFSADTIGLLAKGKNVFSFTLPDSLYASLSLSVTDAESELNVPGNENISSGLFYSSGNDQFTGDNGSVICSKKINWNYLLNDSFPVIRYKDGPYLHVKGKVLRYGRKKAVAGGELTFLMQTKDSLQQFLTAEIKDNGEFSLENMVFEDTATFNYQLNIQKFSKQKVDVEIAKTVRPISLLTVLPAIPADRIPVHIFSDPRNKEKAKIIYDSTVNSFKRTKTLQEVKVIGRRKTPLQIVNDKYTSGLFSTLMFAKAADLINEKPPASARNVFEYIQTKFAGLIVERRGGDYFVWSPRSVSLFGGKIEAEIYVNENPVGARAAAMISMSDVALIKYFPPNTSTPILLGTSAPVIVVYTKTGGEADFRSDGNLGSFTLAGYSVTKEFIAPDYSKTDNTISDNRATILWQPNIFITPETKKYEFSFYNSDHAKKLRVTLEGFTTEGKLIHFEKIIE
jgi:hypothetical protein